MTVDLLTARRRAQLLQVVVQLLVLVAAGAATYLRATHSSRALAVVGIAITAAIISIDPAGLAVLAVPGVLLTQRALGGNISLSDLILIGASLTAVLARVPRRLPPQARVALRALAIYLTTLLVTLIVNQNFRGDLEWIHRLSIVGGSVCIGVWLVLRDLHRTALRLLLIFVTALALEAVLTSAAHGFAAAYPLGYHKNFAGSIFSTTLITLIAAPGAFRLRAGLRQIATAVLALGLLATQSRGAMLATVAAGLVWFLRAHPERRRRSAGLMILIGVGLSYFVYTSVQQQYARRAHGLRIDSLTQRQLVEAQTRALFVHHPVAGVGLRYYKTPAYINYQPPNNIVDEVLAEAGIPGLLGFVVLVGGAVVALRRAPGDLATAGLAVVVGRLVHGAVDIYWVAGTATLPWLIAGMGFGAVGRQQEEAAQQVDRPAGGLPRERITV